MLFWGITQRVVVITDVSGQFIGRIFEGQGSDLFRCFVHVTRLDSGAVCHINTSVEFLQQAKLYIKLVMGITLVCHI